MNLPYTTTPTPVETYRGEQYRLERRDIWKIDGVVKVWCWEVLSGPVQGWFGGKCATKAEARKWARYTIREVGPELTRPDESHS